MTFPVVVSVTESSHDTAVTNHTVTLPTFSANELAIVLFSNNGGSDSGTFPGGWTKLNGAGANNIASSWAYRVCTGSEGASITVTTGSSFRSAHQVYRIQGHNSSTNPPSEGASQSSGATATALIAGNNTGSAKDYLWISWVATDSGVLAIDQPTGYSSLDTLQSGTTANLSAGLSSSTLFLNATTEDPDGFDLASSEGWIARVIAVHPGTEGTPAGGGADVVDPMGMMGFFGG